MRVELIREAKYYCEDFTQIRDILKRINAQYITKKQQTDYIFKIEDPLTKEKSKRIKVRIENEESIIVYIYRRNDQEKNITFDYYEVQDREILSIFTSLYGEALYIHKIREVWAKDDVVFHLDNVEGVGMIFEIELLGVTGIGSEDLDEYKNLFQQHLLEKFHGSNEDVVSRKDN